MKQKREIKADNNNNRMNNDSNNKNNYRSLFFLLFFYFSFSFSAFAINAPTSETLRKTATQDLHFQNCFAGI